MTLTTKSLNNYYIGQKKQCIWDTCTLDCLFYATHKWTRQIFP